MFPGEIEFNELVVVLRDAGYDMSVNTYYDEYRFATNSRFGDHVMFGFCTENDTSYDTINNRIAMDLNSIFECWENCIITLPLPRNKYQSDYVLDQLDYLNRIKYSERVNMIRLKEYPSNCYGLR